MISVIEKPKGVEEKVYINDMCDQVRWNKNLWPARFQSMGNSEGGEVQSGKKKTKNYYHISFCKWQYPVPFFKRFQINILHFSLKCLLPNSKGKKLDFFLSFPHDFLSSKSLCWVSSFFFCPSLALLLSQFWSPYIYGFLAAGKNHPSLLYTLGNNGESQKKKT